MIRMADLDPRFREAFQLDNPTGFNKFLGLRYEEVGASSVSAEFDVTEDLLQPYGIMHGGVYASVVEVLPSLGGTVWLGGKGHCVGVHNSTDFFRQTRAGATLRARATPVHQGRSQQLWRVEIVNEEDKLAASGELRLHNVYFDGGAG